MMTVDVNELNLPVKKTKVDRLNVTLYTTHEGYIKRSDFKRKWVE